MNGDASARITNLFAKRFPIVIDVNIIRLLNEKPLLRRQEFVDRSYVIDAQAVSKIQKRFGHRVPGLGRSTRLECLNLYFSFLAMLMWPWKRIRYLSAAFGSRV